MVNLFKIIGEIIVNNRDANDKIKETSGNAGSAGESMSQAFKKVGAAVATYLSVDAIKNFGLGCIQAAADVQAAESQFTQVFGNLEKNAGKSLSGIAKEAGISENRMKGSFTKIAAFAKTTGMDTESALSLSERAMIAVADSAAFYDRSLEDTTESLQSFLKGNFENDAALGLSCTETTRNAAATKLWGKEFKELSESQKQLTLLQMVEDANKTSGAFGQAARESDTWTNQTGNLKQAWTDFQATIGANILPKAVGVVKSMAEKVAGLSEKVPAVVERLAAFRDRAKELGGYCAEKLKPIFDDVKAVFDRVKETVQPLIDQFKEYVTSGGLVEDITNGIKAAADGIITAYNKLKQFIADVVQGYKDTVQWMKEHETLLTVVAIGVGTLTAAIGAYNVAMAIKRAGGIVEIAQLAATAIGVGALTVAETAHTVATTIATAATTAFGAAMAFLTSPITLVILAIGALIAIVVVCVKHWDTIKAAGAAAWEWIKKTWNTAASWFNEKVIQPVVQFFKNLWDGVVNVFQSIINWVKNNFKSILLFIVNPLAGVFSYLYQNVEGFRNFINNICRSIKEFFVNLWNGVKNAAKTAWDWICNAITIAVKLIGSIIQAAFQIITLPFRFIWENCKEYVFAAWDWIKNAISTAINAVKGAIETTFNAIRNFFVSIWNGIKTVFSVVWDAISGVVVKFATRIYNNIVSVLNRVKNFIVTVWNTVKNVFVTVWNAIVGFLVPIFTRIYEVISSALSKVWNTMVSVWTAVSDFVRTAVLTIHGIIVSVFTAIWNAVKNAANAVKNAIVTAFNAAKNKVAEIFNAIKTTAANIWTGIKTTVSNIVTGVKNTISNTFDKIKTTAKNTWENIKNAITKPIEKARDIIKGIVDKIKGFFSGMKISFPDIKLPHFSIKPKGWKIKDLLEGSIPSLGIDWYAKAMDNPLVMSKPTIFGYNPASGRFQGGGEAGTEVVSGASTLMNMIQTAVAEKNEELVYYLQKLVEILATFFPQVLERAVVLDTGATVGALAIPMNEALGKISARKDRGR